jgi:glycosyltransferase involved in cell wall biosynthesis
MSKIVACMVVKDEEDRYLQSALEWNSKFVDEIVVVDDGSTDGTYDLATMYADHVYRRPAYVPPFMNNEGMFRQYAWDMSGTHISSGDWFLTLDADEFIVGSLYDQIGYGMEAGSIHKFEMWDQINGDLFYRTDGFWGDIWNIRLARFHAHGAYKPRNMGCTSVPEIYQGVDVKLEDVALIHAGYLDATDRQDKYDRYSNLLNHGHNNKHIQSILGKPVLAKYDGVVPDIYRGTR